MKVVIERTNDGMWQTHIISEDPNKCCLMAFKSFNEALEFLKKTRINSNEWSRVVEIGEQENES